MLGDGRATATARASCAIRPIAGDVVGTVVEATPDAGRCGGLRAAPWQELAGGARGDSCGGPPT